MSRPLAGPVRHCGRDQAGGGRAESLCTGSGSSESPGRLIPEPMQCFNHVQLDAHRNPCISYCNGGLKYAAKGGGTWTVETVDATGDVGMYTSLALDAQGNPRISYWDANKNQLKYASAAIEISDPAPGAVWPVGASRTLTWNGTGRVDLYLSTDGGNAWALQQAHLTGGSYRLLVPHTPSKFAKYKLDRAVPYSVAETGLFTIETCVSLLNFEVALSPEGTGADLTWHSDPGPDDLAGYRLERGDVAAPGGWQTLVSLTREISHHDADGAPGSRYRLFAVNGLGEELLLGEAAFLSARPLAAWPLPYRGGQLTVSFGVAGGIGGGRGSADLMVYDVAGRLVCTLANGEFTPGYQMVSWNGRDRHGRTVANGIYFVRLRTGGQIYRIKVVVMP